MGWYVDHVLPRITNVAMRGGEFTSARVRVCAALDGDVVEIGFGSGLNVPHYPAEVTRVKAVEPSTVGRRLAARRVAASPVPVEYVGLFVEHGLAPEPGVARWQDRLTPVQRRVFGGCHLNRPIDELIARAGLRLSSLDTYYGRGPKPFGYLFEGVATKAA